MTAGVRIVQHADVTAQTAAVAQRIASQLYAAHAAGRPASLVVSGGRSPVPLFRSLAGLTLDWSRVWITLADERWVAADSEHSNERLVRTHLLREAVSAAHFVGLKTTDASAAEGGAYSWSALRAVPRPFDAVVLGMGEDGHFASLFPASPGLVAALDAATPPGCVAMQAPVEPQSRISMNLAALLQSRLLLLPVAGAAKLAVLTRAQSSGPMVELPIRALLCQRQVPLEIHVLS